jgi:hypothetical protein
MENRKILNPRDLKNTPSEVSEPDLRSELIQRGKFSEWQ